MGNATDDLLLLDTIIASSKILFPYTYVHGMRNFLNLCHGRGRIITNRGSQGLRSAHAEAVTKVVITNCDSKPNIVSIDVPGVTYVPGRIRYVTNVLTVADNLLDALDAGKAAVELDMSDNPITGSIYREPDGFYFRENGVETYDTDISGIEALNTINIKSLSVRNCDLGPKAITALSHGLPTMMVLELDMSGNRTSGTWTADKRGHQAPWIYDADMSGFEEFCRALPATSIKSLRLRDTHMGPTAITVLASILSTTRLTHLDISGNGLSGATWNYGWQRWDNADSDLKGIATLAEALPSSHLESLAISQCELGPKSIAIVASALPVAGLEVLDASFNRFDATSLLDGIEHSVHLNLKGCYPGARRPPPQRRIAPWRPP